MHATSHSLPADAQATELGIWVSNIPSAGTGNAASCAEHAIYLMLATLRYHNAMADRCGGSSHSWDAAPQDQVLAAAAGFEGWRAFRCNRLCGFCYQIPWHHPHAVPALPAPLTARSIRERRLGVPLGQTLLGKTVLLVGFGNIAKELAVRWGSETCLVLCSALMQWAVMPHPSPVAELAHVCCRRLKPFGVRATALRRRPWGSSKPAAPLPQQDGEGAPWAADGSQQQPAQQQQGSELEAAAEAVLADRGCWPQDVARLAAEADIIAGTPWSLACW